MRYWLHCDCGTLFIPLIYLWTFDVWVQLSSYKHTRWMSEAEKKRERSICNINTELSLMFSFGKHRSSVYFHFHNPLSLMIDISRCSCLTQTPHPNTHITPHQGLYILSLLAVSAAAPAVLGSLCLLHIILLKIKVILLPSILLFLSLSNANLFPVGPVCRWDANTAEPDE